VIKESKKNIFQKNQKKVYRNYKLKNKKVKKIINDEKFKNKIEKFTYSTDNKRQFSFY
jgi:hypothetical protein